MFKDQLSCPGTDISCLGTCPGVATPLPKSMQPSIPPIGRRLSFSTSQVDLTHNDDYHYCIEVNVMLR